MACGGCGKKKVNGSKGRAIAQASEACRPCNYVVNACCLLQLPPGFVVQPDSVASVAYNLNLNCSVNDCSVTCTVDTFDDCVIPTPIITTAAVAQVVLSGNIDFIVSVPVQNTNCDLQLTTFACAAQACVDNPVCIFSVDTILNCDGPFCPTVADSIITDVFLTPIEICGNTAYQAEITLTFNSDVICNNFIPIP